MTTLSQNLLTLVQAAAKKNPDALVALLSMEGIIVYASPSIEQILGYSPDEALGENVFDHFRSSELSFLQVTIREVFLRLGFVGDVTRRSPLKAGGHRWMRGPLRLVKDAESGDRYIFSVARPVSED